MGTSQSSNGSPSGVPMVPPWVPDIPLPGMPAEENPDNAPREGDNQERPSGTEPRQPIPVAPAGRFGNSRRSLREFSNSGGNDSMRRGVGRYIRGGYGGSATATRRFSGTAQTASALNSALSGGASSQFTAAGGQLDPVLMSGRSADEVMDAVVEAIRPVDGTQDTEASRAAIKDALSEVLTKYPDADLLNLEDQQRELAIECYVAADVFRRFQLDVGKKIIEAAPSATTGLARLKEVREYIKETVAASFRKLQDGGQRLVKGRITQIVQNGLRETFQVFEGYAE
ncbi:MAG: hypothetical protein HIU83_03765 [Proteobacteria bacterium]|nr:hypothetical protein [Pseudomonadota bacterium]